MRKKLRMLRLSKNLSQQEMAKRLGVSYVTYSQVELGKRDGSLKFWGALQEKFFIPNNAMYDYMINEGETAE
jgi:transcriptional regulator with XRE-family HTH domain